MSQSCRAHLFFGARLIQQNPRFEIFLLAYFFFQFFMKFLVKIYKKRYEKHNETLWTTDFFNSVFCLVSCSSKNQVPYFKAVTDSNLTRLLLREKKKKFKKTAFRSGLPICHELWDIAFIFFSLKSTALPNLFVPLFVLNFDIFYSNFFWKHYIFFRVFFKYIFNFFPFFSVQIENETWQFLRPKQNACSLPETNFFFFNPIICIFTKWG